jgi:hypothetical protein
MLHRRNIVEQPIKDFFQSILLNTTIIKYQTYDELKVYISGMVEGISMIVSDII